MYITDNEKKKIERDRKKKEGNSLFSSYFLRRFNKLNKINNDNRKDFHNSLNQVLTFKECEIIYQLPKNTCVQDYNRGVTRSNQVRKSHKTFLITVQECERLYKNYWTQRARVDQSHLFLNYDGEKMTENEFKIRYGYQYKKAEIEND